MKLKYKYYLLGIVAITVIGILFVMLPADEAVSSKERVAKVLQGDMTMELIESGELRAVHAVALTPPGGNWRFTIKKLAPEGSYVEEGDFVIQFDTSEEEEALESALDQLAAQEAQYKSVVVQQESQMENLRIQREMAEYSKEAAQLRLELLQFESENRKADARLQYQKDMLSFEELETRIENQKIIQAAELARVERQLQQRKDRVEEIRRNIENLRVLAPSAGMVVYQEIGGHRGVPRHKVTEGEEVWRGTPIVNISVLDEMESVIRVHEVDVDKIAVGDKVEVTLDAFVGKRYTGLVQTIAPLSDIVDEEYKIKEFEVVTLINESDSLFIPGLSTKTRIVYETLPNVLHVPLGAVFENEEGPVVFPERKNGAPQPVTLGPRNDRYIVVEEGVDADMVLLMEPPAEDYKHLGWHQEMQRRLNESEDAVKHIETMEEQIQSPVQTDDGTPQIREELKPFAEMLEKGEHPLTTEQIEKINALELGRGFRDEMQQILTEEQQEVLRENRDSRRERAGSRPPGGGGRGRGGGAPRR